MSVTFFAADELANAAAFLDASRFATTSQIDVICEQLAAYSVGNAWAYNRQYNENVEPVSAAEIRAQMRRDFDREAAKGTLRLLSYNGVTNAGAEINLIGYYQALAFLMKLAFARVMDEA